MLRKNDIEKKGKKYRGYFPIEHGSIMLKISYQEATVLHKLVKLAQASDSVALYVHIFQVDILVFLE